jgi:hypothetical protein
MMARKDGRFIKTLMTATKEGKLNWKTTPARTFAEPGEDVENAYFIEEEHQFIIIYKASKIVTSSFGEEVEQVNIHLVVTSSIGGKISFRLSDYEIDESADLWSLYKTIQRSVSGVDSLMDGIIKKYGGGNIPF